MFGILPTNRTLVDQRMTSLLTAYDIRKDDLFRDLAIHENLTDIYARYQHIAQTGWGSVLPSHDILVITDHLYHVCHSDDVNKGYAVYASVDIPADTILGSYGGELIEAIQLRNGQYKKEAPSMTLFDPTVNTWKKHRMVLDSARVVNLLRFVNDLGNDWQNVDATWVPIYNRRNLFYYTTRNISRNEELSISYGDGYWSVTSKSQKAAQAEENKGTLPPSLDAEGQVTIPHELHGSDDESYTFASNESLMSSEVQGTTSILWSPRTFKSTISRFRTVIF